MTMGTRTLAAVVAFALAGNAQAKVKTKEIEYNDPQADKQSWAEAVKFFRQVFGT
jgi:hypothetical protein